MVNNDLWKRIPYAPDYLVSKTGEVFSEKSCSKRKLTVYKNKYGYFYVVISIDGKSKQKLVHRLVGEVFLPNPLNKPQINHIDGDKSNNTLENLEWVTAKENKEHAIRTGLVDIDTLRDNGMKNARPISQIDVNTGEVVQIWNNSKDPKRVLGDKYDSSAILRCCHLDKDTHKGFRWRFSGQEHMQYEFKDRIVGCSRVLVTLDGADEIFSSASAVASHFDISRNTVYRTINESRKLLGKYKVSYI